MAGKADKQTSQSGSKKSSSIQKRRLPETVGGFTVNVCRNPRCSLFGLPPDPIDRRGNPGGRSKSNIPHGKVSGSAEDRSYTCPECRVAVVVKNNHAIVQEYMRVSDLYRRTGREHCQTLGCENHSVPVELAPSAYAKFGTTAKGDPRFQCKACKSTFSIGSATRRHKKTDKTGTILRGLLNKMPFSRLCEVGDVSFKHINARIDFLDKQCRAFAAEREERLPECFRGRSPVFSTDVQTFLINWPVKSRRGTIPMLHTATVHKGSQFVVAATMDYDPDVDPRELQERMEEIGDFAKPRSMREHGRLWAYDEYLDSVKRELHGVFSKEDLAAGGDLMLPGRGSRVRADAAMYAHLMLVRRKIGNEFRRANFCIDADAGFAQALCALAVDDIKAGRVNVAEVSFLKGLSNDKRMDYAQKGRELLQDALTSLHNEIEEVRDEFPRVSDLAALTVLDLRFQFGWGPSALRGNQLAKSVYRWPYHSKAEPEKTIRLLTDRGDMDWDSLARFMVRASNHPVDAYFNLARRRVAGFERGIPTASNQARIWHAYSFYNPETAPKVANILRFYHNYMLPRGKGVDAQTPAMRLGLAKGVVYERDLFQFTRHPRPAPTGPRWPKPVFRHQEISERQPSAAPEDAW
ncbi:hypothetical protein [Roseovarius sp. TE539]|uniref:hypothetical protein n=1 Tax=Roseovarius sp. TE539 TaxID=2249812 RepID=UPI0011BFA0A9|nr:hypothetical protein [Roseovarius sp. TE539]